MRTARIAAAVALALWLVVAQERAYAQTTVAGFTPGSFRVVETGASSYAIPIRVPPGIAGMHPSLALAYSSQGSNGAMGIGLGIQGLSAIGRCGRSIVQDGVNAGVTYDANDRYCLDGQRLVAISGSYGADGTEYRTERETFTRVISYGSAGTGPAWFKAWTKSGNILEYGNSADSRIEAQGKSSVALYAVNRISDSKGNYLTFTYTEDNANGDFRVSRIDYTGNANAAVSPFASVRFAYQPRTDNEPKYVGGSMVRVMSRLTNVTTYSGETPVTDYRIAYDYGGFGAASRVVSIAECTGDGAACFNPTSFTWQAASGSYGFASPVSWGVDWGGGYAHAELGDVNGDGLADLVFRYSNAVRVAYSNGAGFSAPVHVAFDSSACAQVYSAGEASGCYALVAAFSLGDVNGDGRADVVTGLGQVYLATGTGFSAPASWGVDWSGNYAHAAIADVNGDGLGDLVFRSGNAIRVAYSSGAGFSAPVHIAYDSSACVQAYAGEVSWSCTASAPAFALGDVNGDGRADVVTGPGQVYLATGTGFGAPSSWGVDWSGYWAHAAIADMNGDGLGDLVFRSSNAIRVAYSSGAAFSAPVHLAFDSSGCAQYFVSGESSSCEAVVAAYAPGDIGGDGQADIVVGGGSALNATRPTPDVITRVTDSLSEVFDVAYSPLSNPSIYAAESGALWPVRDVRPQAPLHVVSSSAVGNGIGGSAVTNYVYRGAKVHARGGGFLGFRQVEATAAQTGIKTTTVWRQDYPFHGLPSMVLRSQSSGATLSQATNTWTDQLYPNATGKHHRSDLTRAVGAGADLNGAPLPTVTTDTAYDGFGNATSVIVSTGDGYSQSTVNTYSDDVANWFLGRLTRSQATSTIP